jgi:hypothetical protein
MRGVLTALSAALVLAAGAPQAQQAPVVVELFTSQGCSSCPPADELLAELAHRDDVIALALHVDYWDYIGWKDVFGNRAFTLRQKGYANAAGQRTIYTPQMIVGGTDHVVGFKPMKLAELIDLHADKGELLPLEARREGGRLVVRSPGNAAMPLDAVVQLVRYKPRETVEIERGENAGKTIDYTNIVTDWQALGPWNAAEPLEMDVALEGDLPAVVIVQQRGPGPILAAARVE